MTVETVEKTGAEDEATWSRERTRRRNPRSLDVARARERASQAHVRLERTSGRKMVWTGLTEWLSSRMAFFPPQPPGYGLTTDEEGELHYTDAFESQMAKLYPIISHELKVVGTEERKGSGKKRSEIIVCYFRHRKAKNTILFPHGNAVDLGRTRFFLLYISWKLRVNVVGYDYSGYGHSSGKATAHGALQDIVACWEDATEVEKIDPKTIILYGQSVGTGPTVYLARKLKTQIRGCILQCPFLSGMRVLRPGLKHWPCWADIYSNIKHVRKIEVPVLIIHGLKDEVVPVEQGQKLFDLCKFPLEPLWVDACHDDVEQSSEFLPRLKRMLKELDRVAQ